MLPMYSSFVTPLLPKRLRNYLRERTEEYEEIRGMVLTFFKGDQAKTSYWMITQNPNLGEISPIEMIYLGRFHRLKQWVKNQLDGNLI